LGVGGGSERVSPLCNIRKEKEKRQGEIEWEWIAKKIKNKRDL
jgi:hypothetical protein